MIHNRIRSANIEIFGLVKVYHGFFELVNVLDDPGYSGAQTDLYRRMFKRMKDTCDPLYCDNWWPKFEDARQALGRFDSVTYGTKAWPDPVRAATP